MLFDRRAALALTVSAAFGLSLRSAHAEVPAPDKTLSADELKELYTPPSLGDEVLGKADAPVTIVEYASMTCPHCAHFDVDVLPKLKETFIDTGKVKLIFREFPLDPLAAGASMIARCAPNDNFFPVVDVFYKTQRGWAAANDPVAAMLQIARQAGFTQESFEACLKNQKLLDALNAEKTRAETKFGIDSTPTLFINAQKYRGALPFEDLEKIINDILKG